MEVTGNFALRPAPTNGADGKNAPSIGLGVTCFGEGSTQTGKEYIAINGERQTTVPKCINIFVDVVGEVQKTPIYDAPIGFGRGTNLFFVDKNTLTLKEWHKADTYEYDILCNALGEIIAQYRTEHPEYIVVLITSDAASCNQYLRDQLALCGGMTEGVYTSERRRHYFVGQCSDIEPNQGYEEISVDCTLKEVTIQVNQGVGIVKNGLYGEDAVNVVLDGTPIVLDGKATMVAKQKYLYVDVWKGGRRLDVTKSEFSVSLINNTGIHDYLLDGKLWYNFNYASDGRFYFYFRTTKDVDVEGTLSFDVEVDGKVYPQRVYVTTSRVGYKGAKPLFNKWSEVKSNGMQVFLGADTEEFYSIIYDDIDNTGWYTPRRTHIVTEDETLSQDLWLGSNMQFVATSIFFAQMAYVENLGVKNVLLTDNNNNIIGGMCTKDNSGGLRQIGLGNVKFWLGGENPQTAPARIYYDGGVNFSKGTFGGTLSVARIIKKFGKYSIDESTSEQSFDLDSGDTFLLEPDTNYALSHANYLGVIGTTLQIVAKPLANFERKKKPTITSKFYITDIRSTPYTESVTLTLNFATSVTLLATSLGWVFMSVVGVVTFTVGDKTYKISSSQPVVQ